jgi:hypothetical protein
MCIWILCCAVVKIRIVRFWMKKIRWYGEDGAHVEDSVCVEEVVGVRVKDGGCA